MKKYRWILLPILLCFSVWLLFHTVLLVGVVPSSSMEPTIPEDSIILGNRLTGNLGRGDIIVFRHGGKTPVSYTHLDVYKRQEVGRFIPKDAAVSYLTDSLTGILKEDAYLDEVKAERLKEKYEVAD